MRIEYLESVNELVGIEYFINLVEILVIRRRLDLLGYSHLLYITAPNQMAYSGESRSMNRIDFFVATSMPPQ